MNEVHNSAWFRRQDPIDEINRVITYYTRRNHYETYIMEC